MDDKQRKAMFTDVKKGALGTGGSRRAAEEAEWSQTSGESSCIGCIPPRGTSLEDRYSNVLIKQEPRCVSHGRMERCCRVHWGRR